LSICIFNKSEENIIAIRRELAYMKLDRQRKIQSKYRRIMHTKKEEEKRYKKDAFFVIIIFILILIFTYLSKAFS